MKSNDIDIVVMRKEIMKLSNRLERVQQKYEQAKTVDRKKTLALLIEDIKIKIGFILLDCEDYDKALALYQSMSWDIYGEHKYIGIASALIDMKCYNEARQIMENGLQRFPQSCALLMRMGTAYKLQGHDVDALQYFNRAFKNCPGQRQALYAQATSLRDLGYYENSLSIVRSLIEEDPDHGAYLLEAGYCTLMMGYPEESVLYYKKALDNGFLSPALYGGLSGAYIDMGLKYDATVIAQDGLKEFPNEPGMYENLGECYYECGWIDDAKTVINDGINKFPDDEGLKELLKRIEDDTDDPNQGKNSPLIGFVILLIVFLKKFKEKHTSKYS